MLEKTNALLLPFFVFFLHDFSAFFSTIGPKLCVPVPGHISFHTLLTCLVVSATCLVELRVTWATSTFGCTPAPASLHFKARSHWPLHLLLPLLLSSRSSTSVQVLSSLNASENPVVFRYTALLQGHVNCMGHELNRAATYWVENKSLEETLDVFTCISTLGPEKKI